MDQAAWARSSSAEPAGSVAPAFAPRLLGRLAADALRDESTLTPKPGLVDQRGAGAHDDMDLDLLLRSADVLEPWFTRLAQTAQTAAPGRQADLRLRRELGRQGRQAEAEMLARTGGVNTHRGALFSLGFLVAGVAHADVSTPVEVARAAGELASLPDIAAQRRASHGDRVRDRYPGVGAATEAATGFPAALRVALPVLQAARRFGIDEQVAALDALLAVMAVLDDTCLIYRGVAAGLEQQVRALEAHTAALEAECETTPVMATDEVLLGVRRRVECAVTDTAPGLLKRLLGTVVEQILVESRACIQPYFVAPTVRTRPGSRRRTGIEPA